MTTPQQITVKHRQKDTAFGQLETFTAILPTGRIVGQVEIQIPLERGHSIGERAGNAEEDAIRAAAATLAERIARAIEGPESILR